MGKLELYTLVGREWLRCGYTTGTCAAAVTAGAAVLLLEGVALPATHIDTPAGVRVEAELLEHAVGNGWAVCAVRKGGGDGLGVTDGALICARVERNAQPGIAIDGGQGAGRVIRPGPDQPVGKAAINSTPRRMIQEQLEAAAVRAGHAGGLRAVVSVPMGEALAGRTFNPRLGIEGGISILGTSGTIRPMSEAALLDSLYLEMGQQKAAGARDIVVTPGNYGEVFAREKLDLSLARWCTCSNYIGAAIDHVAGVGFRSVPLVGHLGELIKMSAGCVNAHSEMADARRETLAAHAALAGGDRALVKALFDSLTTGAGVELLRGAGLLELVMDSIAGELDAQLRRQTGSELAIEGIFFSNQHGILGKTPGAEGLPALHRAQEVKTMVHFIGAGPGAEDLITVRGAKLLGKVGVIIYAGSLVNPVLPNYKKESCAVYDSASMTLEQVIEAMRDTETRNGMTVRFHIGDPFLYSVIREQTDELDKLGIGHDVTPSVSSFSGAVAVPCAEYTLPEVSQSVIIICMAGRTPTSEGRELRKMTSHGYTMVLFSSTGLLENVEQEPAAGGYAPDTPAAIVYKATWPEQRMYRCTVSILAETAWGNQITKTALIIIGHFLGDDYERSKFYDSTFTHEFQEVSE